MNRPLAEPLWTEVNGVSLRYRLTPGSGPTLVLVHEMGGTLESWDEVTPALSAGRQVLAYDLRGFGLSEKIHDSVTLQDHVADLTALLDHLGIGGPVALAGMAVGGGISLAFCALHPDRAAAVIGMAPATGIPPERRPNILALADKIERDGIRDLVFSSMVPDVYPPRLQRDPATTQRFLGQQLANDRFSFAATYRMLATAEFAPLLAAIRCPALIVAGAHDVGRPPHAVEPVARQIAGARYQVIESGHFMASQTPQLIAPLIDGFLKEHGR